MFIVPSFMVIRKKLSFFVLAFLCMTVLVAQPTLKIDYSLPGYKMFFSVLVDNCRSFEDENKLVTEMMLKCINGESPRKVVYNYRHCFIKGTASVKILGDALEKLEATIRRPQYYGHTKNEFMRLTGGITK